MGAFLLGLDPALYYSTTDEELRRLRWHEYAVTVCLILAGTGAACWARAAGGDEVVMGVCGAFSVLLVWNLVRLVYAGAGIAASTHEAVIESWRPSVWPLAVFVTFGLALMQGLLLLIGTPSYEEEATGYRNAMVQMHERAYLTPAREAVERMRDEVAHATGDLDVARRQLEGFERQVAEGTPFGRATEAGMRTQLERDVTRSAATLERAEERETQAEERLEYTKAHIVAPYVDRMQTVPLPLLRSRILWRRPWLVGTLNGLLALCFAAPMLLRVAYPRSLRTYEAESRSVDRRQIEALRAYAWDDIRGSLAKHAHSLWEGRLRGRADPVVLIETDYLDPPFNTRPRASSWSAAEKVTGKALVDMLAATHEEV